MHRVVSFAIVGPHELEVGFEDGVVRRINFLPVLEGEGLSPQPVRTRPATYRSLAHLFSLQPAMVSTVTGSLLTNHVSICTLVLALSMSMPTRLPAAS